MEKWSKKQERKRHQRHASGSYCRSHGTMKVVNISLREKDTHYYHGDRKLYCKCVICGKEWDIYSYRGSVGDWVVGDSWFRRNDEFAISVFILSVIVAIITAVVVPVSMSGKNMNQRLAQTDKQHTYSAQEKGVQCNRTADEQSGRKWGDCEVVKKDGVGTYTVKFKEWDKDGIVTAENFRALDMTPAKK